MSDAAYSYLLGLYLGDGSISIHPRGVFRPRVYLDRAYPVIVLRGLIHSDGCRFINTIRHPKRTHGYPRYNFTNRSDDIRALFCAYCEVVGVEWRRMSRWNISVARSASVALMDRHIGPKR